MQTKGKYAVIKLGFLNSRASFLNSWFSMPRAQQTEPVFIAGTPMSWCLVVGDGPSLIQKLISSKAWQRFSRRKTLKCLTTDWKDGESTSASLSQSGYVTAEGFVSICPCVAGRDSNRVPPCGLIGVEPAKTKDGLEFAAGKREMCSCVGAIALVQELA